MDEVPASFPDQEERAEPLESGVCSQGRIAHYRGGWVDFLLHSTAFPPSLRFCSWCTRDLG